jgi:hypothetical protein
VEGRHLRRGPLNCRIPSVDTQSAVRSYGKSFTPQIQAHCEYDLRSIPWRELNFAELPEQSGEERRVVVDAIAPRESVAGLAAEWEAEIARRAELVRTG